MESVSVVLARTTEAEVCKADGNVFFIAANTLVDIYAWTALQRHSDPLLMASQFKGGLFVSQIVGLDSDGARVLFRKYPKRCCMSTVEYYGIPAAVFLSNKRSAAGFPLALLGMKGNVCSTDSRGDWSYRGRER